MTSDIISVTPKLMYSKTESTYVPVWEIVPRRGKSIFLNRPSYKGYRPIGMLDQVQFGKSILDVFDTVNYRGEQPTILDENDVGGFKAPLHWYEKEDNDDDEQNN